MLKGRLNHTLRVALASNHLLPEDYFYEWTGIMSRIALQHDELSKEPYRQAVYGKENQSGLKNAQTLSPGIEALKFPPREWTNSGWEKGIAGDMDSTGDTFMAGVNQAKVSSRHGGGTLIAKWKSPEKSSFEERDVVIGVKEKVAIQECVLWAQLRSPGVKKDHM